MKVTEQVLDIVADDLTLAYNRLESASAKARTLLDVAGLEMPYTEGLPSLDAAMLNYAVSALQSAQAAVLNATHMVVTASQTLTPKTTEGDAR